MSDLEAVEIDLKEECISLAEELDSMSPACEANRVGAIGDVRARQLLLLKYETKMLERIEPTQPLEHPIVNADILSKKLDDEISSATAYLDYCTHYVEKLRTDVDDKTLFLREQDTLATDIAQCKANDFSPATSNNAARCKKLERGLNSFVKRYFPPSDDASRPLSDIIEDLLRLKPDGFLDLDKSYKSDYVELLLRFKIARRNPDNHRQLRLFYAGQ